LGGINLQQIDRLRVTILMERKPKLTALHSIRQSGMDLYNDSFVEKFIRRASEKLELGTAVIRLAMAQLIEGLEAYRLSYHEQIRHQKPKKRELTEAHRNRALDYLKGRQLLRRTNVSIGKTGVVGEEQNRLLMYMIFCSRKQKKPLHIISLGKKVLL
jgi:hypothetical protein